MPEVGDFRALVRRVRNGDEDAAAELVRLYESPIRRAVRMQLRDARLRRLLDSMDIVQSILANFFVRVASGQFDLAEPENLLKLLTTMARNKLASRARKLETTRRDPRPLGAALVGDSHQIDPQESPSVQIAHQELLQKFRERLSEEERQLADLRAQGQGWAAIATQLGVRPDSLRKKLKRALDRVAREMGLEESYLG